MGQASLDYTFREVSSYMLGSVLVLVVLTECAYRSEES